MRGVDKNERCLKSFSRQQMTGQFILDSRAVKREKYAPLPEGLQAEDDMRSVRKCSDLRAGRVKGEGENQVLFS